MNTKKKVFIIMIFIVIVLGFVGVAVYNQRKQTPGESGAPKEALSIEAEAAHNETIVTKVNAKGQVELIDKTIVYPTVQAKIEKVLVTQGDVVRQGQIIVEYDKKALDSLYNQLDDAKLSLKSAQLGLQASKIQKSTTDYTQNENQILQAKANIKETQAKIYQTDLKITQLESELKHKQDQLETKNMLFEQGVIARTEVDLQQTEVNTAKDRVDTAKVEKETQQAALKNNEDSLELAQKQYQIAVDKSKSANDTSKNEISLKQVSVEQALLKVQQLEKQINEFKTEETAPIDGTVLLVTAVAGNMSSQAVSHMEIGDLSNKNLVIKVNVPENKTPTLRVGQEAEIFGEPLGKNKYKGFVDKISPSAEKKQIGNTTETVVGVWVKTDDSTITMRPGYTLSTDIKTNTIENAIVVPLVATFTDENKKDYVFIAKDDFTAEKRYVTLGAYSSLYIQVQGVAVGENIITNPPNTLKDGDFVKIISEEEKEDLKAKEDSSANEKDE